MSLKDCSYKIKGDSIIRIVPIGERLCQSELKIPHWSDRNQSVPALYDLAWLASVKEPVVHKPLGEVRAIDLFCGCGGLTLGIREACRAVCRRFVSVYASDINTSALSLYKKNFNPEIADNNPIESIIDGELGAPVTRVEQAFSNRVGKIDIIVAGPPCQGNSDLNNHTRRNDPKNLLYLRAVRCVEVVRPDSVIIENVPGVKHEVHGVLQTAVAHLQALGYYVSYDIVHMKEIGTPQRRKRMILVASLKGQIDIAKEILDSKVAERSLSWACSDLLDKYDSESIFNSSATHSATNQRRIKYLFDHDIFELPNSERPDCHRLKPHNYLAVYGRMHWDEPAPTITGGFGSCGQGRFIHPLRQRTLTPHEAARVQCFPDFFDFSGVKRRDLQLVIGNAVPSKAGYVVALPLLMKAFQ